MTSVEDKKTTGEEKTEKQKGRKKSYKGVNFVSKWVGQAKIG